MMTTHGTITYAAQVQAGAYLQYQRPPDAHSWSTGVSGIGSLEQAIAEHGGEFAEGAWIVDAREVPWDDCYRVSVHGPMFDHRAGVDDTWQGDHYQLADDLTGSAFTATIVANYGMTGLALEQLAANHRPGPFDQVPPATLAAMWREVGAKVGRWYAGEVQWIPAPEPPAPQSVAVSLFDEVLS